ncbi:hypothetical protein L1049_008235 [Liquidambar formosana]|uniref:Uncharacterized protein n=1 Tax=Liquidambar formosana TaxID=63359 RepID=A0AAP0S9I6_LIQFO
MEGRADAEAEVLLMSKTVEVQRKRFCFDLKESSAGQFLRISYKTSSSGRSTLVLPSSAIVSFLDAFNSCMRSHQQQAELPLQNKVFHFHVGENQWGRFLKVSEASVNRNPRSIIIPAGNSQNEGWEAFGRTLVEIKRTSSLLFPPNQQNSDPSQCLTRLANVSAGFISGHSGQSFSTLQLNGEPLQDTVSSVGVSKVMRAGPRSFFFDPKSTQRGHFLKISEVMGANHSSIFVPLSQLKWFHEMVGDFLKVTNDSSEGLSFTFTDAKQPSSPHTGESSESDFPEKPHGSGKVD